MKSNVFIQKIIKSKRTCVFISPHLDDAILSCGELVSQLENYTKVIVVNVFSAGGNMSSFSAKQALKASGFSSAEELFKARKVEDKKALELLHIKPINLDFHDALWREKTGIFAHMLGHIIPELGLVYPTYRWHVIKGNVSKADALTIESIAMQIEKVLNEEKAPLIFAPYGIGGHVDHLLTKIAVDSLHMPEVIYWSDFPYNIRNTMVDFVPKGYSEINIPVTMPRKSQLISTYKTQVNGLFENGKVPSHTEHYSIKERISR